MYSEYEKVKAFLSEATLLKEDSKIEDIYRLTIERNLKNVSTVYVNEKGKIDSYKYKEFNLNALAISKKLSQILSGQIKNVPIALKLSNGPHWPEVFYAILMSGFKPLLVDARLGKEGTQNIIEQSKAIAIISDDLYEYDVRKISLGEIKANKKDRKSIQGYKPTWENEVIFCSSGTTGDIKLMVYNGANLAAQIRSAINIPENTKDLMYPNSMGKLYNLAMIPLHHIFGFVAVFLWFTYFGKAIVYPASISTKDILGICQKVGVTHVFSVPLLWDGIVQSITRQVEQKGPEYVAMLESIIAKNTKENPEELDMKEKIMLKVLQKKLVGNKVRYCISGGGYLSEKTMRFINGLGYPLYNGYGMTEVGVASVEEDQDAQKRLLDSIGKGFAGYELKIIPSDKNVPNVGELIMKSPTIHVREIIGGKEQGATLDEDGYFHSGDIAQINDDGRIYIKGRIKDIIINADGENIFPDEVEFFFKKVAHVSNLTVVGIKKGHPNYEDIALVLEVENSITDEEFVALKEEVNKISSTLPKGIKIKDVYFAKGKLPLSSAMKVKKFIVKKAIEDNTGEYVSMNAKVEEKSFDQYDPELVNSIREKLRDGFSKILYLPKFKITDSGHWINDLGGDSMSYVELIQYIETEIGVQIPEELYGQLTNINDFLEEILKIKSQNK